MTPEQMEAHTRERERSLPPPKDITDPVEMRREIRKARFRYVRADFGGNVLVNRTIAIECTQDRPAGKVVATVYYSNSHTSIFLHAPDEQR